MLFLDRFAPGTKENKFYLQNLQRIVDNLAESKDRRFKEARKQLKKITNLKDRYDKLALSENQQAPFSAKYYYVLFESDFGRNLALEIFQTNILQRFFYTICSCFAPRVLLLDKQILRVEPAPAPQNINWKNIYYHRNLKYLLRFLSFVFTVSFLIASLVAIVALENEKNANAKDVVQVDCSNPLYSDLSDAHLLQNTEDKGLVHCYCEHNLQQILTSNPENTLFNPQRNFRIILKP